MRSILFLFVLFSCNVFGQYILNQDIVFNNAEGTMQLPFCGGLNTPQFSQIDMNQDGKNDLYVYDGSAYKHLVFINTGSSAEPEFKYAPEYEKNFPAVEDWAVLHDFNCDDIPDFLAYKNGGTILYKGEISEGTIVFNLYKQKLTYTSTIVIPIYTARTDIVAFDDIDSDGDMDVLAFAVAGTLLRFYKNKSAEMGYGCDSLIYNIEDYCWGQINEGAECSGAELGISCIGGFDEEIENSRIHVGSTILVYDQDNDGDKDLILGDVSCDNIVYYENGGSADFANMIWKDTLFPSYDFPLKLHLFPASFLIDFNNDSKKDLLVAPNDYINSWNTDNIWYYKNISTADTFYFEYQTNTLLSEHFVDAGANSRPVFFDFNADGLQDILIGVSNTFGPDNIKKYGMWLYKNIGTTALPQYEFYSNDYAAMGEYLLSDLAPFPADIDGDGDIDLLLGLYDGTFILLENIAGAGNTAIFNSPVFNYQSIDVGGYSVPCLFDVNGDGSLDLISGKSSGILSYYENTGTTSAPAFTLISENWGGVDVRKPGSFEGYSAPFMFRNSEGLMQLAVGSFYGFIHLYDEIEESLAGEFHQRDTLFLGYVPGFRSSIFGYNIFGDEALEFIVGNVRGGIQIFEQDPDVSVSEHIELHPLKIFPNPAGDVVQIYYPLNTTSEILVYNMEGQLVYSNTMIGENILMNIQDLSSGLYILQVRNSKEIITKIFIKN
ncbi:MAG: T9SS type A sorting domain-containing protein [Bacteroidetes bacterium]|nr:T9SS type A sorting domain-containing protein [Bacteroidota bacterium]